MQEILKAYLNITMEGMSSLFLLILFLAVFLKKNQSRANKYFIGMTAMEILVLLGQIIQWIIWLRVLTGTLHIHVDVLFKILYSIDFSLMNFQIFAFFCYIIARAYETGESSPYEPKRIQTIKAVLLTYASVCCLLFISSAWTNVIYTVTPQGQTTYTVWYMILLHASNITALACIWATLKNRRSLSTETSVIMILFVIARETVLPFDIVNNTSFSYIFLAIALEILYFGIEMQKDKQLLDKEVQLARKAAEVENKNAQIMISQIQPHFLYNTLSVIDYLCEKDPQQAREAVTAFSDYLRMNMDSLTCLNPVPFEKELEHTKTYLWIEKLRFGDILTVEYDIQNTDFLIPPLTLQPLCENAVKHGIRGKDQGGTVKISTCKVGNSLYITVTDDGIGFDPGKELSDGKSHIGIKNVRKRLSTMVNGTLDISSEYGKGTVATIVIGEQE